MDLRLQDKQIVHIMQRLENMSKCLSEYAI